MKKSLIIKPFAAFALVFLLLGLSNSYAQNYWQQKVQYRIQVRLDDSSHILHGNEEVVYQNNSPETLQYIWFHLWPNAYKNDQSAFAKQQLLNKKTKFHTAAAKDRGYIDSLAFEINQQAVKVEFNDEFPDICKIILNAPLLPGQSLVITTPFRVKIPASFSRLGHVKQAYQITQWYPKPAVFDHKGWHPISYLDQGEFYSEFGSFDVKITLPSNYIVASTGNLKTISEQNFLDSLANINLDSMKFHMNHVGKINVKTPASAKQYKTLHYVQDSVHDFAWFADKDFIVRKSSVRLPISQREVKTWVMYKPANKKYWEKGVDYVNEAVYNYSLWNGEYPYNACTAIDGALSAGGGMEYPMVTVIGGVGSAKMLETVIVHEVGHNWFYGILGSNERKHGWMDEGLNTFYENRVTKMLSTSNVMIGDSSLAGVNRFFDLKDFPQGYGNYLTYMIAATLHKDQAIETPSADFTPINYGAVMYTKSGLVFYYLQEYLGLKVFDSAMHVYFDRWKFKHPYPEDLKAVLEEVSGKKLDWFFEHMINSTDQIDFKLSNVQAVNNQYAVKVQNRSGFEAPAFVSALDRNGNVLETFKTEPYIGTNIIYFDQAKVSKIQIDPYYVIPEVNRNNNVLRVKGPLKSIEPFKLQAIASITNPKKSQLFFMPIIGYNSYDKWMPGIAFYNHIFPFKKFEYELAPMYSTQYKEWNGLAKAAYHSYPSFAKEITYMVNFATFNTNDRSNDMLAVMHYDKFSKASFNIDFEFKQASLQSNLRQKLSYRFIQTNIATTYGDASSVVNNNKQYFHVLNFNAENSAIHLPHSLDLRYEFSNSPATPYHKIAGTFTATIPYQSLSKGLNIRLFGGYSTAEAVKFSGVGLFSVSGDNDYLFDQVYTDRNSGRNFYIQEGGFKAFTSLANASSLISLNIKAPLPIKAPIGVFADAAYLPNYFDTDNRFNYAAGIYFPIINNLIEVYMPFYVSTFGKGSLINTEKPNFKDQIRFMINLTNLQPLNLLRKISI